HGDYQLLGRTRDDAAGEAFDKVAKVLGLGYPGGPIIDTIAQRGDPRRIEFPRAYLEKGSLDFSFSGLKTSVFNHFRYSISGSDPDLPSIAASFQDAVVDVLTEKSIMAVERTGVSTLAVGGGVASNSRLRERLKDVCEARGLALVIPLPRFCVDNACMIGAAGFFNQERATRDWGITPQDSRFTTCIS
ncbi:MAG: tRNA (adenosine(37)-N6)-threonylcarbamoyltransferase complex transferase subunit TsaD, partial [Nitrospirae bacterium]|nr:tRNA (adenosine(37)-N6)-threonylcarbamoyltransferase complex transferase subunit TsaD [Nitrospirota bacterium]